MPERVTVPHRSEKSAEAVVAGASLRRAEREGVESAATMCWKWHQTSALAERSRGDSVKPQFDHLGSDEDRRPRPTTEDTGLTSTS